MPQGRPGLIATDSDPSVKGAAAAVRRAMTYFAGEAHLTDEVERIVELIAQSVILTKHGGARRVTETRAAAPPGEGAGPRFEYFGDELGRGKGASCVVADTTSCFFQFC